MSFTKNGWFCNLENYWKFFWESPNSSKTRMGNSELENSNFLNYSNKAIMQLLQEKDYINCPHWCDIRYIPSERKLGAMEKESDKNQEKNKVNYITKATSKVRKMKTGIELGKQNIFFCGSMFSKTTYFKSSGIFTIVVSRKHDFILCWESERSVPLFPRS